MKNVLYLLAAIEKKEKIKGLSVYERYVEQAWNDPATMRDLMAKLVPDQPTAIDNTHKGDFSVTIVSPKEGILADKS